MSSFVRIIRTLNPRIGGGVLESLYDSASALKRAGHSVKVISLDGPASPWLDGSHPFEIYPLGPAVGKYGLCLGAGESISRIISREDIIIIDGIWQFHSVAAMIGCLKARLQYHIYVHGMLSPWFRSTYPLKHIKKLIYWTLLEKRVFAKAASIIYTSQNELTLACNAFPGCPAQGNIIRLGCEDPTSRYLDGDEFLDKYSIPSDHKLLLFIGRLHEVKGIDLLLHGFHDLISSTDEPYHLIIAGPDEKDLKKKLVRIAHELHISSSISWTGKLSSHDKWSALRCADALCLPSHQENFGLVVVEALAVSTPVIISDKVNIFPEIINANAGLVHQDNIVDTCKCLLSWHHMPEHEKQMLGDNARRLYERKYQWPRIVEELLSLAGS